MELINQISILILPLIIAFILLYALIKRTNVYEAFVDGAKDGINCAVSIIPYLLAIIVAISMLQASGVFEFIENKFKFDISRAADELPAGTPGGILTMSSKPLDGMLIGTVTD